MDPKIIDTVIDQLNEVKDLLVQLGPLEDAYNKAKADYDTAKSSLEDIQKELTNAKSGLSLAQMKNLRDYEEAIFNKSQEVKTLETKTAVAQATFDTVNVQVAAATAKHQQIEDSITSLRMKIG